MEYIFGTVKRRGVLSENLKTVGDKHSDLTEFVEIKRSYSDCDIIDRFHIIEKYKSVKHINKKCYDWYIIDHHYRYIDYTKIPKENIAALQETTAFMEDAMCEFDALNEERIAAIEDALCEMDAGAE